MSILDADFWERAAIAVRTLDAQPALSAAVQREVDNFFDRHPALIRTRVAEAFIARLVIERLSTPAADSQSAAPTAENKKVA